jgi:FkbM family methyltransferase
MSAAALVDLIPGNVRVAKRALVSWWRGEPELRLLPRLCPRDELALDIGANLGVYAWHLARLSAGVVAFEPQPGLAASLRDAFGDRVRVEQAALSDEDGEAVLRVPSERMMTGRATIEAANALDGFDTREVRVPTRRLDGYGLGRVGFMKIDVEGHELAVLRGADAVLRRDRPSLIVESEDRHRPGAVAELRRTLGEHGYRGFALCDGRLRDIGASAAASADAAPNNFIFVARSTILSALL